MHRPTLSRRRLFSLTLPTATAWLGIPKSPPHRQPPADAQPSTPHDASPSRITRADIEAARNLLIEAVTNRS